MVIFQDGNGGLEIQDQRMGQWFAVLGKEVVLMWGRAGEGLLDGIVRAVNHRVNTIPTVRRTSAIAFIGVDDSAKWKLLVQSLQSQNSTGRTGNRITVGRGIR
jgi:isopenicillin N synthase-like dioxygenase